MGALRTTANSSKLKRATLVTVGLLLLILVSPVVALEPSGWQDTQNALYPEPVSPWPPDAQRIGSSRVMPSNQGGAASPSAALYRQLRQIGLDPSKVYKIRGASIDREDVHMTLEDGVIAFTEAVDGRVTGAFFEGQGELL